MSRVRVADGSPLWPIGQAVKTPPFHGGNRGSIPLWVTNSRDYSSAGRAPALQAGGHRFEPCWSHHLKCGLVVQLVRMPACHAGGRGFESLPGRQFNTLCWCGSTVEQLTCNQQVVGSTPITSSNYTEDFPSGQRGQTVNLLASLSVVRIHHPPPTDFKMRGCSSMVEFWPSKPAVRVRSPSPAPN